MKALDRYQLKQEIDQALRQYGASAVSWETSWSQLVIRKYDHPYSADRSVIFETFIRDEQDWQRQRPTIEQELAALEIAQQDDEVWTPDAPPQPNERGLYKTVMDWLIATDAKEASA